MSLVFEDIFNALYDRVQALEGTTVYGVQFNSVPIRLPIGQASPEHGQVVIEMGDISPLEELDVTFGEAWNQTFNIRIGVRDEDELRDWSRVAVSYAMAVKKNVANNDSWHTMDGFAIDAKWGPITQSSSDGGLMQVNLELNIKCRISEYDPEVQR